MGIEPLLFVAVFLLGFVLQGGAAVRDALTDRLRAGRWMSWLVARFAEQRGLRPDGRARYRGIARGHPVELLVSAGGHRQLRDHLRRATGVTHRRGTRMLPVDQPGTLLTIYLTALELPPGRLSALGSRHGCTALGDPVLDQLVRFEGEPSRWRALLSTPAVRDPLLQLLGEHPLSVLTDRTLAVWVVGEVRTLEPVEALAFELVDALRGRACTAA